MEDSFWNSALGKALRWIAFLPVTVGLFGLGDFLAINIPKWWAKLPSLLSFLTFPLFLALFVAMAIFVSVISCSLAPSKRIGAVSFSVCVVAIQAPSIAGIVSRKGFFDVIVLVKVLFLFITLFGARSVWSSEKNSGAHGS